MEFIELQLEQVSSSVGFPMDQLRAMLCLLLVYPAAFVHKALPSPTVKHIYAATLGFGAGLFCFGWMQMLLPLSMALPIYVLSLTRVPNMPRIAFLYCLGFLSFTHIYRMITDYAGWSMDVTGPLMLLTVKLTSYAYNVQDGRNLQKCTGDQKLYAVEKVPSIIEFLGFAFYFAGFVAGPTFEFQDYMRFTTLETFKNNNNRIPDTLVPALKRFAGALGILALVVISKMYLPVNRVKDDEFYETTSFWFRCFFVLTSVATARFPYYFAWTMAEGSCVASGLGYGVDEKTGKVYWDGVANVKILSLETAQNFKGVIDHWNMNTGNWLRRYVYERVTPAGKKPTMFATVATYMTSAFWHGFYPGYYFTFFSGALVTEAARKIRRNVRPLFLEKDGVTGKPLKVVYDFAGWFFTQFILNYICTAFVLLTFDQTWRFYKSMYFCGHLAVVAVLVFFHFFEKSGGGSSKGSKASSSRNGTAASAASAAPEHAKEH